VECWAYPSGDPIDFPHAIGGSGSGNRKWQIWFRKYNDDDCYQGRLVVNGTEEDVGAVDELPGAGSGDWTYIVLRYDGSEVILFANMTGGTANSASGNIDAIDSFLIGNISVLTPREWKGKIDEVRVSHTARSDAWLKATYETGRDNLLKFGGAQVGHTRTKIADPSGNSGTYTTIQSAVDALPNDGGVVYVERGEYTITSPISIPDNVSIIGRGNAKVKIDDNSNICAIKNSDYTNGNKGITILGLHITAREGGQQNYHVIDLRRVDNVVLRDLSINGDPGETPTIATGKAGIGLGIDSEGNTISNCTIENCGFGIFLYITGTGPSKNTVEGCFIHNIHTGIYLSHSNYNVVRGNRCHDMQGTVNGHDGILCEDSALNIFQGNECNDGEEHGIYISTSTGQSWGNTVIGNVCRSNNNIGIHLNGAVNVNVHKNTLVGNTCTDNQDGIVLDEYARYNTVTGNICSDNGRDGVWDKGAEAEGNIILGNICLNNSRYQIHKRYGSDAIIEHNRGDIEEDEPEP